MANEKAQQAARANTTPIVWDKLTDTDIALLTATAKGWRPETGDEIRGRVLAVKIGASDVGVKPGEPLREYPIVFILRDGATEDDFAVSIHAFHAILRSEFMSQRPEYGDHVFVKNLGDLGREAPKGINAPEVYAVHVTKPNAANRRSAWDVLAARQGNTPTA